MAVVDSDMEILEFAVLREAEAHRFYKTLAKRADRPGIRQLLEELAEEELAHRSQLEFEIVKRGRTVPEEPTPQEPSARLLSGDDASAPLDMDIKRVLDVSMEKEEASFRTYVNLLGQVQQETSREILLELAEEEVRHKLRFETQYDALLSDR